ncbi:MAG: hypothetical protein ACTSQJ_17315 [Promethearchaeota archaeon]
MSLEDELKLQEANNKISKLIDDLNEAKEKISDLMTQYNEAKNKEIMLSGEVRSLQAELKAMQANLKNVDILNDRISFLEKERKNLREELNLLEQKIEQKEKKIETLSQDKEKLFTEKAEVLESKNEILQKITQKELDLQQKDQKIAELRMKFKNSSSELLSKTMEIERLNKKISTLQELEEKIKSLEKDLNQKDSVESNIASELQTKIKSLEKELEISNKKIEELKDREKRSESTRVILDLDGIIEHIKQILPLGKSAIRLVLPEIHDLNKFGLTNLIKEVPSNVILNIAAKIENPFTDQFIREIKQFCQLTNYSDKKFIAINADSSKFLIGLFKNDTIIGIYTEIPEFINLFKQAIMEPFIKGKKVF